MLLEEKISQDYIAAMKQRDTFKSGLLSLLRSQVKNVKIDKKLEVVSDEEVVSILKKQIKQRQESIVQFKAGNRLDLSEKEEKELEILNLYLPQMASVEVIQAAVEAAIKETSATSMKDMGKVMKEALVKLGGKADNQQVSALVKERLAKI